MKYHIGDIIIADILNEKRIALIIKYRMWNEEVDYKLLVCGMPNEYIWVLERMIKERIYEV
jgi:hypothetical protein